MMDMPMNDGDISMTMTQGLEQTNLVYKKFLDANTTHSNHVIQYHMQQIMERQMVINKYGSAMADGMDLTPLESNSYKSNLAVISPIIHMIEVDNFWHQNTFEVVLADIQRNHDKEIHEQENKT